MKKTQVTANFALLLTGIIWGLSFVAQRAGMEFIGPFTFNAVRSFLGALSLLPVICLVKCFSKDFATPEEKHARHIEMFKGGLCCGTVLFLAMSIQQICMKYVTAGKGGFISSLYLIFVPLISVFLGKKLNKNVVISVFIAVAGLYLLCFKAGSYEFNIYDAILLISAGLYGVHILVVDYFSSKTNAAKLSCVQFLIVSFFSMFFMLGLETPTFASVWACRVPLFYAGVLTCGVAFTLQIFGQKYTPPVIASLLLSLESVFAVLGGMVLLCESMTGRELLGCFFMIFAVILSKLKFNNLTAKQWLQKVLTATTSLKMHLRSR